MGTLLTLGIETSCDETASSVVLNGRRVLSNVVRSQIPLHAPFGGVVPEIASRAHAEDIGRVVGRAIEEAGVRPQDLTCIAVTNRPGLIGSLLVGLTAAKALAFAWKKPLVAVDHIHAHILGAFLGGNEPSLPAVALVVSGGHTVLLDVRSVLDVRYLGGTTDDAAGEAFDKVAKILGLGYPGGPAVAEAAERGNPAAISFPRPLLGPDSLDFSFSGIKTAVLYTVQGQQGRPPKTEVSTADVAASFQEAVVDTLVEKCSRALSATGRRSLLVGGGVAANARLREKLLEFSAEKGIELAVAKPSFSTDNAAMVAALGSYLFEDAGSRRAEDLSVDAEPDSSLAGGVDAEEVPRGP